MGNDGAVVKPPQNCEEVINIDSDNYIGKIYKKGKNIELDDIQNNINLCKNLIEIIKNKLNDIMVEKLKIQDAVKVENNDRD